MKRRERIVICAVCVGMICLGVLRGRAEEAAVQDPVLSQIREYIEQKSIDKTKSNWRQHLPRFPDVTFSTNTEYRLTLKTNKGDIALKMLPEAAPNHVANFLYLAELGFFDGLTFHRVIPGFMAQGGCPVGTGTGSPGYRFDGEFSSGLRHNTGGLLSMANAGPGTDGSQFFITFVPTPWLDGKHTIFGKVVEGMVTLKTLEKFGTRPSGRTTERLVIEKAKVSVSSSDASE